MSADSKNILQEILSQCRTSGHALSFRTLIGEANRKNVELTDSLLFELAQHFGKCGGPSLLGPIVSDFISKYATEGKPTTVVSLWCGIGLLLRAISSVANPSVAVGISRNAEEIELARSISPSSVLQYAHEDPRKWLKDHPGPYDLIVGSLPFHTGWQSETLEASDGPFSVQDDEGQLGLLHAVSNLSDHGNACFVVSPRFVSDRRENSVRANLEKVGGYLNALISFAPNQLTPVCKIGGYLAIISRRKGSKLFVAELSDNKSRNEAILRFFLSEKEGRDIALGRWVEANEFSGWRRFAEQTETEESYEREGEKVVRISDVTVSTHTAAPGRPFSEVPNSVFVPTLGTSASVTSRGAFQIKEQNYLQLILQSEKVTPAFLASFLNTPRGRSAREAYASGGTIPKLTKASIGEIPVLLPPLTEQVRYTEVETMLRNMQNRISELQIKLQSDPAAMQEIAVVMADLNKGDDFEGWLDSLPFPLATILWHYHVRQEDPQRRYEQLLHFFEALAELLATILISGFKNSPSLHNQMRESFRGFLREGTFRRSTFASWVMVLEALGAHGRKMVKERENGRSSEGDDSIELTAFNTQDLNVLGMIFSQHLLEILKRANMYRNTWLGHSGAVSEPEARRRLGELEALLAEARGVIGRAWSNYEMVRPIALRYTDGVFFTKVERLMGVRAPFVVKEVEANSPLDDKKLYLFDKRTKRGLEVAPLIKILASPRSAQNACYFYNRTDREGVRFVNYYFESEAEIVDVFPDTKQLIDDLLPEAGE